MGLDMYVFKAQKINKDWVLSRFNNKRSEEIPSCYTVFDVDEEHLEDYGNSFDDLRGFYAPITLVCPIVQIQDIAKDNGILEEVHVGGACYGNNETSYSLYNDAGKNVLNVTFTRDEIQKYVKPTPINQLIMRRLQEVCYWRKAYDIAEAIEDACESTVENCGYYKMTPKMIEAVGNYDEIGYRKLSRAYSSLHDDEILVYHEWY